MMKSVRDRSTHFVEKWSGFCFCDAMLLMADVKTPLSHAKKIVVKVWSKKIDSKLCRIITSYLWYFSVELLQAPCSKKLKKTLYEIRPFFVWKCLLFQTRLHVMHFEHWNIMKLHKIGRNSKSFLLLYSICCSCVLVFTNIYDFKKKSFW